ncbi:MAG: GNAT family N-acetyltransferase [Chiayiivirga sp.]|jgi:ElaA protein|uniref:GNAT family N-acetyltransferase n=1 Tax=Chiayiivirga sp. TaxID=2041042 RepID=UPI0025C0D87B|nr:GNAT family N-acetyltransferase [Chiayiivirga sp.]MCI1710933.1 GNAT family N-acetyltransferase [Chiayiivirga sp.]MCI1728273.1 GNAT family N-acetyltransferase [Chiayiivirga sp.]
MPAPALSAIHWRLARYDDLERDDLWDLLTLRCEVFVVEQRCAYLDPDEKDRHPDTRHLLGRAPDGQLAAYLRLLAPGLSYAEASFGRVIVAPPFRGTGLGHALVRHALQHSATLWPGHAIQIGAQAHLVDYYATHGFRAVGDEYDEDGIPHRHMRRAAGALD